MSSFKRLNKADATTTLYAANKSWRLSYSTTPSNDDAYFYVGFNIPFSINEAKNNGQYGSLIYDSINHLFYQNYTGSLDTGSIMFNVNTYESASQQRPTSSYFDYNTNPFLVKQFPSGASERIGVLSINQDLYGSKILPNSFQISASSDLGPGYLIRDDGYGNLYDISRANSQTIDLGYVTIDYLTDGTLLPGISFVGNIFYAQGIAVITNQSSSYQGLLNIGGCTQYTFNTPGTYTFTDCLGIDRSILVTTTQTVCVLNGTTPSPSAGGTLGTTLCIAPRSISFQNEHIIYENEVRCIVRESNFNLTYNPSLLKYGAQTIVPISGSASNGYTLTGSFDNTTIKDFATASFFQPYVTTIGLYNDNNDLLMVAKLAKPIMLSPDTDTTFIVRYDT
jgi:hypothetical protein